MVGTGRFELPNMLGAALLCLAPLTGWAQESAKADSKVGVLRGSATKTFAG